jgi:hypothetical protein
LLTRARGGDQRSRSRRDSARLPVVSTAPDHSRPTPGTPERCGWRPPSSIPSAVIWAAFLRVFQHTSVTVCPLTDVRTPSSIFQRSNALFVIEKKSANNLLPYSFLLYHSSTT